MTFLTGEKDQTQCEFNVMVQLHVHVKVNIHLASQLENIILFRQLNYDIYLKKKKSKYA